MTTDILIVVAIIVALVSLAVFGHSLWELRHLPPQEPKDNTPSGEQRSDDYNRRRVDQIYDRQERAIVRMTLAIATIGLLCAISLAGYGKQQRSIQSQRYDAAKSSCERTNNSLLRPIREVLQGFGVPANIVGKFVLINNGDCTGYAERITK